MRGRTVRLGVGAAAVATVALWATACGSDGREMRPAAPGQSASVSTVAPTTLPEIPPDDDGFSGGITLPPFTTVDTTLAPTSSANGSAAPSSSTAATTETTTATTTATTETTDAPDELPLVPQLVAPWQSGAEIDARHTCDGANVSPTLRWSAAPAGTVEIAVALTDDDAPGFFHWAVAGIDPSETTMLEDQVPDGAIETIGSSGTVGWFGPCPPPGTTHTYRFTVYFLGQPSGVDAGDAASDTLTAIRSRAFDSATVTGTYSRP